MYTGLRGPARDMAQPAPSAPADTKVNRICAAVRAEIEARPGGTTQFRRTLLTTFVCQRPPDLEAALLLIKLLPGTCELHSGAVREISTHPRFHAA